MASEAEPWGRVTAEAMLAGVAVVGVNTGATPEIIQHGVTGLVVPHGDAEQMAGAILKLLREPEAARRMAEAGRRWVQTECNPQRHAEKVAQVYETMLANP